MPGSEIEWPDVPVACPDCGNARITWDYTCHTWPRRKDDGTERWMSCMPCSSAIEYWCGNDDCDWHYDHGLNPRNPRAAANEAKRPAWLPEKVPIGRVLRDPVAHPEVRSVWSDDDDGTEDDA